MPNSGLISSAVDGGGIARGANDNGVDLSATEKSESIVSPKNRNDTTRCNINMAYYSYQKQVYQRQILLQQQQQQQQQLKLRQEEQQYLGREVDPEGERQDQETDELRATSQHRDRVNKAYSPPYRKQTSDDDSFDTISDSTVVKEATESADNQQKRTETYISQKMDTSCAQNNHIPEPCHVPGDPSSKPISEKKRQIRSESSAGMVVHIPTSQQKKPKTSHPYHIPTPSPNQNVLGGSSPLPHPSMMQQFGQKMNSYAYGHLGMQPTMPPHGMAPPPLVQYYNPPPPPHPGFIPNHGNNTCGIL